MKEILGSYGNSLKGKTIVLAITGSVAAVKSFEIARELIRNGARVQSVMSKASLELVGEKLMEFATGKKPITEISGKVEHVKFFGKKPIGDLLLIAPATANTISKIAMGVDDTTITTFATTAIGSKIPVLIAPAMHEPMYNHPIVKENLTKLQKMGAVKIIAPLIEEEKAKISSVKSIVLEVKTTLSKKTLSKKKVLVISGTTIEEIDPIRIITTNASGKTGEEIAIVAHQRGAQVTLLHNKDVFFPQLNFIKFNSFNDLEKKTMAELKSGYDILLSPAAIGDFEIKKSKNKLDSNKSQVIEFVPRKKLIKEIRKKFPKLFIVGFKALTNKSKKQLETESKQFLKENNFQMVIGNDVSKNKMGNDSNEVVIVSSNKSVFVKGKKELIAQKIIEQIEKRV